MRRVLPAIGAILVLAAATAVDAHICLTYPIQRGPHPRLYPGDDRCFNRVASCGSLPQGAPTAHFTVGSVETLTFQQNLNHWYQPKPGYFDLAVSYDNEATWVPLGTSVSDFPANNMNTQTYFNVPVVFPQPAASAIVRARYVSHNPDEVDPATNTDAVFYSCADVAVAMKNGTIPAPEAPVPSAPGSIAAEEFHATMAKRHERRVAAETSRHHNHNHHDDSAAAANRDSASSLSSSDLNCDAPSSFVAEGVQFVEGASVPVMHHTIHYDAASGWVKWNRNSTKLGGDYDVTDLWNLTLAAAGYTPQFIIGMNGAGTCSMYGGDAFFPWAFGPKNGMTFLRNETATDGSVLATWGLASSDFEFSAVFARADDATCLPHSIKHGVQTIVLRAAAQSIDPSVFAIPAACGMKSEPEAGCKGHHHRRHHRG